jgi:hypothetical protein
MHHEPEYPGNIVKWALTISQNNNNHIFNNKLLSFYVFASGLSRNCQMKFPAHRAGLPGKEAICSLIAPLIPAHRAGLAGCVPVIAAAWQAS